MTSYDLHPLLPYKANCLVNPFLCFLFFHFRNSSYLCSRLRVCCKHARKALRYCPVIEIRQSFIKEDGAFCFAWLCMLSPFSIPFRREIKLHDPVPLWVCLNPDNDGHEHISLMPFFLYNPDWRLAETKNNERTIED